MSAFIKCAEAAELAGVPESTVRQWTRDGRCPGLFRNGRAVLIHRDTFIAGLAAMSLSFIDGNVLLEVPPQVGGAGHDERRKRRPRRAHTTTQASSGRA
jgi:excisionase family DNA binding protein